MNACKREEIIETCGCLENAARGVLLGVTALVLSGCLALSDEPESRAPDDVQEDIEAETPNNRVDAKDGPVGEGVPDKLSREELRAGVAGPTAKAKTCGTKYDAKAGTKVIVKVTIEGASGTVRYAQAIAPHGGTALGDCVAAPFKDASFRKFTRETAAVVVPVAL